jgi:GT2 family glycosyltransferase
MRYNSVHPKMNEQPVSKVSIIIVNYNGAELLRKHLPSVLRTEHDNYEVVVVDNGSTDTSLPFLRDIFPTVKVIKNDKNLGFGRANNVAFHEHKDSDYYALVNNDVEVSPTWLSELTALLEQDESIGAIGPRMLYSKKRNEKRVINSAGGVVDRFDRGFDRFDGCDDGEQYRTVEEVDFVTGGAVVLRRKAVEDVGGFDEHMFFYYEDVDLCLRMRDRGWKIVYNGKSIVLHDHMGTSRSWGSSKVTISSNMNRIRSISRRRGAIAAGVELLRTPLEWLIYSLYGKITGKTYREFLLKGRYECRNSG